jgi:tetratricopeptide (TPR) repeat protein
MARVYYEKALFAQAIDSYRTALALNPASDAAKKGLEASEGLLQIASAAASHRELEQRRTLHEEDLVDPAVAASIVYAQKDEENALKNYQAAVRLYEEGAFTEAKKRFTIALAENPSLQGAWKGLAASDALARISEASSTAGAPAGTPQQVASDATRKGRVVGIEVSNGNGAAHMAREIAEYLKARGFTVVRLTNADHFNHDEGSIVYEKDYEELAGNLAGALPRITDVRQAGKLDRPNVKVKVVVGKDMVPYRGEYRIQKN